MTNKDIVMYYMHEVWLEHNLAVIEEVFAEHATIHSPFNVLYGSLTMRQAVEKWLNAFPDLHMIIDDYIAEDNKVVCRWHACGTHMGSFFETNATHTEVAYSGVSTYKIEAGKVVEFWSLVDVHTILKQLGVLHISDLVD